MVSDHVGFAGRARELERLEELLSAAERGASRTALVTGEAGIGKSTLVEQAALRALERGHRVLVGRCLPVQGIVYDAFVDALGGLAEELGVERLGELAALPPGVLRAVVPEAQPFVAGDPQGPAGPGAQTRLFDGVGRLLRRLAEPSPVLVVVEDLHWAHPTTLALFCVLSQRLADQRVTLIGTERQPGPALERHLAPLLTETSRGDHVDRLHLLGLSEDEVAGQLGVLMGEEPSRVLVRSVLERSEGNPLFVRELAVQDAHTPAEVPHRLRDLFETTLLSLPDETQHLVRLCAAAGRRVHHLLLCRAFGLAPQVVADRLRPAVRAQILVPDGDGVSYGFRHVLLAETAGDALLPGESQAVHGRLAEALEGEPGLASTAPAAELAHHWGLAGEPDKALLWSVTAAEEADAAHALDAALLHLDRAVELWDVVPDAARLIGRERWQVLSWQGSMANLAGQNDKAIALMERAVEEHRGDPDGTPAELGALYSRLTICLGTVVPHAEETLQASRRALELVPVSPASAVRAEALASAAHLHLRIDVHVARDLAREAAEVAGTVTARPLEARARTLLGMSLASVGDLEAGLASIDEAHALGVRHELHEEIARSAMCRSQVLIRAGRLGEGAAVALEGVRCAREGGVFSKWGSGIAGNAASALFLAGRWDEAARQIVEVDGDTGGTAWLYTLHARLLGFRGLPDEAARALRLAREHRGEDDPRYPVIAASLALLVDDPDSAARELSSWRRLVEVSHDATANELCATALRAAVDRAPGLPAEEPRVVVDELLGAVRTRPTRALVHASAWGATAYAEASRLEQAGPDPWREATEAWRLVDGWWHARSYCLVRLGESHALAGAPGPAREALAEAVAVAEELGSPPLLELALRVARTHRLAFAGRNAPATGPESLTVREQEVLRLIAAGHTNRLIARDLGISEKTVSVHVSNVLRKLQVGSRTEAAGIAFREGLVADP
ncbi:helix-turn-helix transcriptional regulator [uncultured Nocardioides sp.]|uniref:helix-turn-helix transcriptional regulator n=3 Tax=uncultured Nocardioides sp. TaxID=198441 RepID=UPI002628AAB2|nr:helix-turn-helix transcriptional regulator [uncultured Nocardioides sp.]